MPNWLRRLRARWRYRRFQDEIAREIETHRAMAQAALQRSGVDAEEARTQATRALGNATLAREDARAVWIAPWLEGLWQDVKYAARSFRRQPGFAAAVILILALGGGLVTAAFSVGYGVFLRPWPVPDPNAVVLLMPRPAAQGVVTARLSIAEFRYLDQQSRTFLHLALGEGAPSRAARYRGEPVGDVRPLYVSRGYLGVLGTRIVAGRAFMPEEHDYASPAAVAVLSRGLWRRVFGSDPAVLGQPLQVGRDTFTIVGVADSSAFTTMSGTRAEVALPLPALALGKSESDRLRFSDPKQFTGGNVTLAGRLAPGVRETQAATELTALSRQFREAEALPPIEVSISSTRLLSQGRALAGDPVYAFGVGVLNSRWQTMQLAFVALLFVHLLSCANAGNLLLARGLARQRELAIRQALGAGRRRLVRQLLVESVVLSACAGALASGIAYLVPPLVVRLMPGSRIDDPVDATVLAFCVALSTLTAIAAGLAPALRSAARSAGPLSVTHQTPAPSALRLRRVLLSTQVALATTLLVGAGLLGRAVAHAAAIDPGFDVSELQVIEVAIPGRFDAARDTAFFRDLQTALNASGAAPVALTDRPPLVDEHVFALARRPDAPAEAARMLRRQGVSENYFEVTGVRLLAGRAPRPGRPLEVVVSARTARELWPEADPPLARPLLHVLGFAGQSEEMTVVGVAEDAATTSMTEFEPSVYFSLETARPTLLVRDLSRAAVERVRAAAGAILAGVTVTSHPLRDHILPSLATSIASSRVAWGVSALGLLLATIGAFGVFAYAVEERKREIGIRLALGAARADVVGAVWATAQRAMIVGLTVGLALAMGGAQLLRRFLHGLSPFDPIAYLQIAGILLAAAALATWIPARRAARVDPAVTLRTD